MLELKECLLVHKNASNHMQRTLCCKQYHLCVSNSVYVSRLTPSFLQCLLDKGYDVFLHTVAILYPLTKSI